MFAIIKNLYIYIKLRAITHYNNVLTNLYYYNKTTNRISNKSIYKKNLMLFLLGIFYFILTVLCLIVFAKIIEICFLDVFLGASDGNNSVAVASNILNSKEAVWELGPPNFGETIHVVQYNHDEWVGRLIAAGKDVPGLASKLATCPECVKDVLLFKFSDGRYAIEDMRPGEIRSICKNPDCLIGDPGACVNYKPVKNPADLATFYRTLIVEVWSLNPDFKCKPTSSQLDFISALIYYIADANCFKHVIWAVNDPLMESNAVEMVFQFIKPEVLRSVLEQLELSIQKSDYLNEVFNYKPLTFAPDGTIIEPRIFSNEVSDFLKICYKSLDLIEADILKENQEFEIDLQDFIHRALVEYTNTVVYNSVLNEFKMNLIFEVFGNWFLWGSVIGFPTFLYCFRRNSVFSIWYIYTFFPAQLLLIFFYVLWIFYSLPY